MLTAAEDSVGTGDAKGSLKHILGHPTREVWIRLADDGTLRAALTGPLVRASGSPPCKPTADSWGATWHLPNETLSGS